MKLTINLERATDTAEETWVSHCLELDVILQGRTPQEAIEAIAEAVDMMVRDEITALENSGQIENPGWARAFANIADDVAWRDAKAVHHCAAGSALLTCGRPRTVDTLVRSSLKTSRAKDASLSYKRPERDLVHVWAAADTLGLGGV